MVGDGPVTSKCSGDVRSTHFEVKKKLNRWFFFWVAFRSRHSQPLPPLAPRLPSIGSRFRKERLPPAYSPLSLTSSGASPSLTSSGASPR